MITMTWIDVCGADEVAEQKPRIVEIGEKQIGVLRWRDEIFAVLNRCGHAGAPIALGEIHPKITAAKPGGQVSVDPAQPELRCPWHHWGFDLNTGLCTAPVRRPRLKTYPTQERDGRVWVDA